MKIVARHIERDGGGSVTLVPEHECVQMRCCVLTSSEDLYHLYNLIQSDDLVRATAVRRVQSESTTGSIESHRVRMQLTIQVAKMDFEMGGGGGSMSSADGGSPQHSVGDDSAASSAASSTSPSSRCREAGTTVAPSARS